MRISIIGLGYVGLPLASLLASKHDVVGFDADHEKISRLKNNEIPINEPNLVDHFLAARKSGKLVITDNAKLMVECDVKIITVGTPYDPETDFVDYSQINGALDVIVPNLKKDDVLILKSTVPPGTTMGIVKSRIENAGFDVPKEVGLVFSPERMIEGQAIHDFQTLPKIIGASDERSAKIAGDIMNVLGGRLIFVSTPTTAETIKMVDNYSRFVFLGLTNELALSCEKIGVDVLEVIRAAKLDYPRNAGILFPGPGVGGSCLNKDPFILRGVLKRSGLDLRMIKAAEEVNYSMPDHVVDMISHFRSAGKVTIFGVAFKGDTDDTRYSPSLKVRTELIMKGYSVSLTDPYVRGEGILEDMYGASKGSNTILIMTDHSNYKGLDLRQLKRQVKDNPLLIDTRGLIDRKQAEEAGFEYHGLGRL